MLAFRDLALRRGGRPLLSGMNLVIHAGWKVGVVGRNGCGKSSLLAAIRGELEADAGVLERSAGLRIASVAQETAALPDAAIDYVLGGDVEVAAALHEAAAAETRAEHVRAANAHQRIEALHGYDARARAGRLMHGLGFGAHEHERPVAAFSGGWRVRLNLARALMAPSDLLLLDEPTNHLDLDAIVWLEQWLRRYPGTVLVVSHDREFLDGVTSHVLHLEAGCATLYTGNYSAFERQHAEQLHQQQSAHDREQAERAHLEAFITRFRAKATKARQAQSRMRRLEKLAGTEAVRAARPFHFAFPVPTRLPQSMLHLDHVDAGYAASAVGAGHARDQNRSHPQPDRIDARSPQPAVGAGHARDQNGSHPQPDGIDARSPQPAVGAGHARDQNGSHPQPDGIDARSPQPAVGAGHARDQSRVDAPCGSRAWPAPTTEAMQPRRVLSDVSLKLQAGDRIGLLGRNGAGKSTLVKTLVGELAPLSGERLAHKDLTIGYFAQHTVESLHAGAGPLAHMAQLAPDVAPQELRDWLGRWNFVGERVLEPVDGFSGGERARLALALLAWRKPGLLVLDEPTNHLDMDMREALAEALNDYPGALVLVSHDRHLLGLVCDDFWHVADARVTHFEDDLDAYARVLRESRQAAGPQKSAPAAASRPDARTRRQAGAAERERTRAQRKRLNQLEAHVADIERRLADLDGRLADPQTYLGPTAALAEMGREQGELRQRKAQLEDEWLDLSAVLEESAP